METDLLPLSELVLEPSVAASRHIGEGHTLTLRLDLAPVYPAFDGMSGRVSIDETVGDVAPGMRAAVVPSHGKVMTITF